MTPLEKTTEAQRAGIVSTSPVLDTPGAAHYIGVDTTTLETWRSTKRVNIKFIRVGRCVRYRITDLDAFLESQAVSAGEQ